MSHLAVTLFSAETCFNTLMQTHTLGHFSDTFSLIFTNLSSPESTLNQVSAQEGNPQFVLFGRHDTINEM